jgi:dolichol-phosphate mannosyltransferase
MNNTRIMTELSIIIPTYNEQPNIRPLLANIERALPGVSWEVIFVDDNSADGTADLIRDIARRDPRVRCLLRVGRRGLSSACIEGMCASSAPFLAVMDADLQHDDRLLPGMLAALRQDPGCDLVIGSRYTAGGGVGKWNAWRAFLSRLATKPARCLGAGQVTDPMSGFFMLRREVLAACLPRLAGIGFKILLDLLASSPRRLNTRELPYEFRARHAGASKLSMLVVTEYGMLLLDKTVGRLVPVRFLLYVAVGSTGVVLHLTMLGLLYRWAGMGFLPAQSLASAGAMVANYFFNNTFTYSDLSRKGRALYTGLLGFLLICAAGLFINIQAAEYLHRHDIYWWLAGLLGAGIGAIWNFGVSSQFVWRPGK